MVILKQSSTISGTIFDESGQPLPNIAVRAIDPDPDPAAPVAAITPKDVMSDGYGNYAIANLAAGRYVLCVPWSEGTMKAFIEGRYSGSDYAVGCRKGSGRVAFTLTPGSKLQGINIIVASEPGASATLTSDSMLSRRPLPAANDNQLGSIEGRTLTADNQPLGSVTVTLTSMSPGPVFRYSAISDSTGYFVLRQITSGSYSMNASRPGYAPWASFDSFKVKSGEHLTETSVVLRKGAGVSGRVFDADGDPLRDVQLELFGPPHAGSIHATSFAGVYSNEDGEFSFSNLPAGQYLLGAIPNPSGSDLRMMPSRPARRSQRRESYIPTYYPSEKETITAVPIQVVEGQNTTGIDLHMIKTRVFVVNGKITSDIPNVPLEQTDIQASPLGSVANGTATRARAKDDGSFILPDLVAGQYAVMANAGIGTAYAVERMTVTDREDNFVQLRLLLPVHLNGVVRIDKQQGAIGSGIRIDFRRQEGGSPLVSATTNGEFVSPPLEPGNYRVSVSGVPADMYTKSIFAGRLDVLDSGIAITGAPVAPLEVVLGEAVGRVGGHVRKGEQALSAPSVVTIAPTRPQLTRPWMYRRVTVNENGDFSIQNIPPGDYRLYAWDAMDDDRYCDPDFLLQMAEQSTPVSITERDSPFVTLIEIKNRPSR